MKTILESLLQREIRRVLRATGDDSNADFVTGQLTALRWALAKVRRRQRQSANRKLRRFAPNRTSVL